MNQKLSKAYGFMKRNFILTVLAAVAVTVNAGTVRQQATSETRAPSYIIVLSEAEIDKIKKELIELRRRLIEAKRGQSNE